MDFRNQVKQALRHFGHAIVSTIHSRLNSVEMQLHTVTAQTADTSETQTTLLQSEIYVVELLRQLQAELEQRQEGQRQHLEQLSRENAIQAQEQRERFAALTMNQESLRRQNEDLKQQVESLQSSVAGSEESQAALMQSSIHLIESLNQTHSEIRQQVDHVLKQIAVAEEFRLKAQESLRRELRERIEEVLQHTTSETHSYGGRIEAVVAAQESLRQELRERVDGVLRQTMAAIQSCGAIDHQLHLQADQIGRTTELLGQMHALLEAGTNSNEAQGSLLQTGVQLMDCLKQDQRLQGDAFRQQLAQLGEQHNHISDSTGQVFQQVLGLQKYTQNVFDQELVRQVCVETSDYGAVNPETGLMEFLYSFLPTHKALDIGAHVGDVSARLLKTGYEVFAFEPYSPSYKRLTRRLAKQPHFHPHNFALGSLEEERPLHLAKDQSAARIYDDATVFNSLAAHAMPGDLPFVKTVIVPVKDLAGLHRSGTLPADISLVKIDTEGYDLEVIRGMQDFRYPVILAEFWDREIPFGKSGLLYTLDSLIEEMKARGYGWHIVIYRIWGQNQRAFYCNHDRSVPGSWGNIAFFQNFDLFAQAQTWCSATLPRTFFKPAPVQ